MISRVAMVAALVVASRAQTGPVGPPGGAGGEFKPGWNGKALTPPLGWRSWNAFGNRIYDATIRDAIDAITIKNWTVDGEKVSLADVGYASVGIDEGWEGCGMGVNHTQHYVNGTPAVNPKFPDMKALVDYGHSKNLKMGFYQNGCACGERVEKQINYEGDVVYLDTMGFDGVKLDGCGRQRNMTLYAELMKAIGKNFSIENCHWGDCTQSDDSSCPTLEWCPFNWYRSSGDINAGSMSWFHNLQTTIRFQSWEAPVSRPGCWAYPDMLEVGRVKGSIEWNRAHFGAWCIVSAPLVLGMDLTEENLTPIIDIITNKEAIAVNQAWEGHPGSLVWQKDVPPPPTPPSPASDMYVEAVDCDTSSKAQTGWSMPTNPGPVKINGMCLDANGANSGNPKDVMVKECDGSSSQNFSYTDMALKSAGGCLDVFYFNGPIVDIYACNGGFNQKFTFTKSGQLQEGSGMAAPKRELVQSGGKCVGVSSTNPSGGGDQEVLQLWAKPQANRAVAILLINTAATTDVSATVELSSLNITAASVRARNIWTKTNLGSFTRIITTKVPAQDSAFILLTPNTEGGQEETM